MHYEILGCEAAGAPTLVLSSGLGGSARFWTPQLPALTEHYRVVVYDQAGTGRSPASLAEGYSIATMAGELLDLLDELDIHHCHFIGHALGGLVGLELALQRPQLLDSMVLINAWSSPNSHSDRCFSIRKHLLIAAHSEQLAEDEAHALAHFPQTDNLLRRIAALQAFDIEDRLEQIDTPTLLIANRDDMLVPWQRSQHLADKLSAGRLALLDYGGHASSVSDVAPFNRVLLDYLASQA
jgi:aminoacrylate hydrolase